MSCFFSFTAYTVKAISRFFGQEPQSKLFFFYRKTFSAIVYNLIQNKLIFFFLSCSEKRKTSCLKGWLFELNEDSFEVLRGKRSDIRLVWIKSDLPGHTGAGAGAVHSVQCAVCRVQCAACQRWRFSSWNRMSQIKILS